MPVNDFEKQVQLKMEELQLRPSGQVWEEVEKRVRTSKRRRRIILWFSIIGALVISGLGILITQKRTVNSAQQASTSQQTISTTPANPTNSTNTNNHSNGTTPDNITTVTSQNPTLIVDQNKTTVIDQPTINDDKNKAYPVVDTKDIAKEKRTADKPSIRNVKTGTRKSIVNSSPDNTIIIENAKSIPAIDVRNAKSNWNKRPIEIKKPAVSKDPTTPEASKTTPGQDEIPAPVKTDTTFAINTPDINPVVDTVAAKDIARLDELVTNALKAVDTTSTAIAAVTNNIKLRKQRKWEFGVNAIAGQSQTSRGFTLLNGTEKSLDAQLNSPVTGNGQAPLSVGPVMPGAKIIQSPGFYWQIGGFAKRKMGKRMALSIGLDFSTYSTRQKAGTLIENNNRNILNSTYSSDVSSYVTSGSTDIYTNRYAYLRVPISIHWQVTQSKKVPIFWENGFSAGTLVSDNALIFSPSDNLYYKDDKLINKMAVGFHSGVYVRLMNQKNHPLLLGGTFTYNINNLQKVNTDGRNHLTSFGLRAGWIIKK